MIEEFLKSIFAGAVQGSTEFLPISSSGHLFLINNFFSLDFGMAYFVLLHLGTVFSVLFFFRKEVFSILRGMVQRDFKSWKLFIVLLLATIPAAVLGFFLENKIENFFSTNLLIGINLLITGTVLLFTDRIKEKNIGIGEIGIKKGLIIGLFQAIAILPGISRSGMTISGALFYGIKREDAVKFSFLLSIPVITGGFILEIKSISFSTPVLTGFFVSFLTGFLALWLIRYLTIKRKLKYFSFYCYGVGIIAIVSSFF